MRKQKGFALAESLLLTLLVAIIGLTGFYVWQSEKRLNAIARDSVSSGFTAKKKNEKPKENAQANTASKSATVSVKMDGDRATVDAPKTWLVSSGGPFDTPDLPKATTITAPNGDVYVRFERLGGLGGVCAPEETTATLNKVMSSDMTNLSEAKFAQFYVSDGKLLRGYFAGMVNGPVVAPKLKEGMNACNAAFADVITGYKTYEGAARLGVYSKKLEALRENGTAISSADYEAFVSSAEFALAKSIVQSLRY